MVDREKMSKSLGNFFTVRCAFEILRCRNRALLPDVRPLSQPAELRRENLKQARAALGDLYAALRGTDKNRCACGWRSV